MTVRDIGLSVVRALPSLQFVARAIYAALPERFQDTPTRRMETFFADAEAVAFVQIGAFDGVAGDPLRSIVSARPGWSGTLVEPQPEAFARLLRNYAGASPRLSFLNAAVAAERGTRTLYAVERGDPRNAGLPDWADEVASLDASHVRKHFPGCAIAERTVRTVVFSEVAESLAGAKVDLVIIDVEGSERAIIETIDFDRHGVRFLIYEHKHLTPADSAAVVRRLRDRGFALKPFGRDTIAWRSLDDRRREPGSSADDAGPSHRCDEAAVAHD